MNQQRHDFRVLLLELVGLLSVMAIALINISHAATINVDSSSDALQNDDNCTLREAVQAANTDQAVDRCAAGSGADIIVIPAGTYTLTIAGANEDDNATGDLSLIHI